MYAEKEHNISENLEHPNDRGVMSKALKISMTRFAVKKRKSQESGRGGKLNT
jgi:hypothetical protein